MVHRAVVRTAVAVLLAAAAAARAPAQDLRDRVVLVDGSEVRGRVVTPFAADEVLLRKGGQRVRVPRDRIAAVHTITLDVAAFLDERLDAKQNPRFHWMLTDWAKARGLDAMARLQALQTVRLDPDHADAHAFLGHRLHPEHGWLWPIGSRWTTFERWQAHHAEMGRALELESEHFAVRTSAGLGTAIDTLIDLERMYVFVFAEFGAPLGLHEAIEKLELEVWSADERFPSLHSESVIPYFKARPFGDRAFTRVLVPDTRPDDLFTVGVQALLYRCLANDAAVQEPLSRLCAWAEVGFGRYVQGRLAGPPGAAAARPAALEPWELTLARTFRTYGLANLIHLSLRDHFHGFANSQGVHWASSHAFVQFLLDPAVDKDRPARFLDYLRQALRDGKGDSSTLFDDALGVEVEQLEGPFAAWLARQNARRGG